MNTKNTTRMEGYTQVCVWPDQILPGTNIKNFIQYFRDQGFRIQHLETLITSCDRDNFGVPIPETGGRIDVIFAIHDDDLMRFCTSILRKKVRWIEDVLDNEARKKNYSTYPLRVHKYRTW